MNICIYSNCQSQGIKFYLEQKIDANYYIIENFKYFDNKDLLPIDILEKADILIFQFTNACHGICSNRRLAGSLHSGGLREELLSLGAYKLGAYCLGASCLGAYKLRPYIWGLTVWGSTLTRSMDLGAGDPNPGSLKTTIQSSFQRTLCRKSSSSKKSSYDFLFL